MLLWKRPKTRDAELGHYGGTGITGGCATSVGLASVHRLARLAPPFGSIGGPGDNVRWRCTAQRSWVGFLGYRELSPGWRGRPRLRFLRAARAGAARRSVRRRPAQSVAP